MEQEIPRESLLVKLNQKMTIEFDKILTDARGIKKTILKLEEAEVLTLICNLIEKLRRDRGTNRKYSIVG